MYPTKPLGEIIKITKGKKVNYSPEKGKYNYIDIGILRTGIIEQYTNDEGVFCDKEDILIAWDGSKSGTSSFGLQGVIGSTLAKLKLKDESISTEFVGKFLQSNFEYLNKNTSGAAIPHLRKDILENLQIPLPPLPTQQKIVSKLDNLFENIDKNISLTKQNIANIDEENNAILEKIFKECEEKFGSEKIEKILDKNFSIGKIPVKEYLKEGVLPIIDQGKNFIGGYTNDNSQKYSGKLPVLVYGDHTNSVKFIDFDFTGGADGIKIFKFGEKIDTKYMFYVINYYKPENLGYRRHFPILKQIQTPLPPLPSQQKIVEKLDKIFSVNSELKNFYEKNLKNLEELKQSILKQAFEDEKFIK